MVLGWPLPAPITVFTLATKNTVQGADRAQVLLLLQQALIYFCRRLITKGFTVQCLDYDSSLLITEGAWLHRLLTTAPRGFIVGGPLPVCVYRASIEAQRMTRPRQWQSFRAMRNHVIHTSFPLRKRSSIDKAFFCKSRQSLAISNLRFKRLFSFTSCFMRR